MEAHMATVATTVLVDGKVEIPEEALKLRRWSDGSRLRVVETADGILLMEGNPAPWRGAKFSFEELIAANKKRLGLAPDAEEWRALGGILSDDLNDTLEEKHRLRDEELAHDQRMFES